MSRENAMTTAYEEVTVCQHPALFTSLRIDRSTVPEGMFLYEIRHDDESTGDPCQLARHIVVNHFGSVLTSDPIQLPPDGCLNFEPEDFSFPYAGTRSVSEFLEKHPSSGKDAIDFFTVEIKDVDKMFYSQGEEQDRANGCIGYLRGDFGGGKEFWTTWWPSQGNRLNVEPFKKDIDRVINWLRQDSYPLHDLSAMQQFCSRYEHYARIPDTLLPSYGFRIDTKRYQYMLRCCPVRGDYNFYCYCYDKEAREQQRTASTKHKRPAPKKRAEPER